MMWIEHSLFLARAARPADEHAPDAVERDEVPVRALPELLLDRRLAPVDLAPVRADVRRLDHAHGEVEPRAVLRDRPPEVLRDELPGGRGGA